jgi:hypothetical protein
MVDSLPLARAVEPLALLFPEFVTMAYRKTARVMSKRGGKTYLTRRKPWQPRVRDLKAAAVVVRRDVCECCRRCACGGLRSRAER